MKYNEHNPFRAYIGNSFNELVKPEREPPTHQRSHRFPMTIWRKIEQIGKTYNRKPGEVINGLLAIAVCEFDRWEKDFKASVRHQRGK